MGAMDKVAFLAMALLYGVALAADQACPAGVTGRARGNDHVLLQMYNRKTAAAGAVPIMSGHTVFLKSPRTGNRITVETNGVMHCHWNHTGGWQKLTINKVQGAGEIQSGDKIFVTAWTGNTVTVEGQYVHAHWNHRGGWQQLVIESRCKDGKIKAGGEVALRGHTGSCIDIDMADDPGRVKAPSGKTNCQELILEDSNNPVTEPEPEPESEPEGEPEPEPEQMGWRHKQGSCRTAGGTDGDFHKFAANRTECMRRCGLDSQCTAWEFKPPARCENHWEDIVNTNQADTTISCYLRIEEAEPEPWPEPEGTFTTFDFNRGACRTADDTTGDFHKFEANDYECRRRCALDPMCVAYEFKMPLRCENHFQEITHADSSMKGFSCWRRKAQGIDGPGTGGVMTTTQSAPAGGQKSPDGYPLDSFGVKELFPSGGSHRDWVAEWQTSRTGYGGVKPDGDTGATFRGGSSNRFVIGNGEMVMDNAGDRTNTPRYYIHKNNENVEFTAYFWVAESDYYGGNSYSKGPTLVVRSNHHLASDSSPCEARGYYMRFTPAERTLRFLKEKKHGGGQTKYSFVSKGPKLSSFPWGQWVGLKFVVRTRPNGDVHLQVFMDLTDGADGGEWELQHERTDSVSDSENMYGCSHASVFGEGGVAFIRADSLNPIKWKKASLREVKAFSAAQPAPWVMGS